MEPLRKYTSKHLGVKKRGKGYNAQITRNNVTYNLGTYNTEVEAAMAYNNKAMEFAGLGPDAKTIIKEEKKKHKTTSTYKGVSFKENRFNFQKID
jgi:hypothetical protein